MLFLEEVPVQTVLPVVNSQVSALLLVFYATYHIS